MSKHLITEEQYLARTGHKPKDDDLERCNCDKAGQMGHLLCGWCGSCGLPTAFCGHSLYPRSVTNGKEQSLFEKLFGSSS